MRLCVAIVFTVLITNYFEHIWIDGILVFQINKYATLTNGKPEGGKIKGEGIERRGQS